MGMVGKLKTLSLGKKIGYSAVSIFILAAAFGGGQPTQNQDHAKSLVAPAPAAEISVTPQAEVESIEVKSETRIEAIPYSSSNQNDATLEGGKTKVGTIGVNGERTIIYEVTFVDGAESTRKEVSNTVTKPQVNEVIKVGTKTPAAALNCPNGTYVNSANSTVCRPHESSSAPAGASAKCKDGTYSFSQSRRGTCSHHGGVSSWL